MALDCYKNQELWLLDRLNTYNKRAPEMWEILISHLDFHGKRVVDFGCGRGDFLQMSYICGAQAIGYDIDERIVSQCHFDGLKVRCVDIEEVSWAESSGIIRNGDIAILFSVIPYLRDPDDILSKMADKYPISLIECQYAGDGPAGGWVSGLPAPNDDSDMIEWLKLYWSNPKAIGWTEVSERGRRTIWVCRKDGNIEKST